ncbi:MAG: hypothetical protein ABIT38_02385 [Gemmatimonadaceae bacterium]
MAVVDSLSGLVSGYALGTTTVRVTADNVTGAATVSVLER